MVQLVTRVYVNETLGCGQQSNETLHYEIVKLGQAPLGTTYTWFM